MSAWKRRCRMLVGLLRKDPVSLYFRHRFVRMHSYLLSVEKTLCTHDAACNSVKFVGASKFVCKVVYVIDSTAVPVRLLAAVIIVGTLFLCPSRVIRLDKDGFATSRRFPFPCDGGTSAITSVAKKRPLKSTRLAADSGILSDQTGGAPLPLDSPSIVYGLRFTVTF